ncbi:MAG: hypothetical protein LC667_02960 [Thioalkalivibrio sp.]|nr:hypothetical protein [Thioalkalivibrio sp.]
MSTPEPRPRAGLPGKPIPVRALQDAADTSPPESALEEMSITVDGVNWSVVADGACEVGGAVGAVHLIMLSFGREDEGPSREAWVAAGSLGDLSASRVETALRGSAPRPERREEKGFFEELGGRRRR